MSTAIRGFFMASTFDGAMDSTDFLDFGAGFFFDVMTSKKKPAPKSKKSVESMAPSKVEAIKKPRIAVLIADDHSVVREGLASLIGRKADMTVDRKSVV